MFALVRLPVLLRAPGGQDEEWYGIPGLTVANEGIPRVPYSRATDDDSVFRGADEILFAQPPLSFYAQAPFFLLFSDTYATARLASFVAACAAIAATYVIARLLTLSTLVANLAAVLFSLSRLCFFPALLARPDMICGTLGLAAIATMIWWQRELRARWLVATGAFVGLAALTHPFAIVFGIQTAVWTLLAPGSITQRIKRLAAVTATIALTFSLWLPLIWQRPDLFRSQFVANILRPTGPGLLSRAVMPLEAFANQMPQLVERAHPIQFSMLGIGLLGSIWIAWRHRHRGLMLGWVLATSSIYLLVVCLGTHPIQGFWCYSASLGWICFAACIERILSVFNRDSVVGRAAPWVASLVLVALMIPGSGLRASMAYVKHWSVTDYDSSQFIRQVLRDIPEQASITVGPEFSLDAYGLGRDMTLACNHPMYFDSTRYPTEFYLFGRRDLAAGFPTGYRCTLVRSYGQIDDIFSNYVELYQRSE